MYADKGRREMTEKQESTTADKCTSCEGEEISIEAYIKQAIPFLEEAWMACFHGEPEALLSAEERGMGRLLSQFRMIAEGEHPLPPGLLTRREATENTENAIKYWTSKLGNANEPVDWLKRWIKLGETMADALKRADEAHAALKQENGLLRMRLRYYAVGLLREADSADERSRR